jgi:hypothetical protein
MHRIAHRAVAQLTSIAVMVIVAACSVDHAPSAPSASELATSRSASLDVTPLANRRHGEEVQRLAATLRRVTARYHDIEVAKHDHFVLLHGCETRLDDEPVGTVYVNLDRLTDGVINPEVPDALIYEPSEKGLKLVGVEFAIPFTQWPQPEPPQLLGTTFQREDEFGVFALHAWVWRHNPNGMFAETNPRVTCSGT